MKDLTTPSASVARRRALIAAALLGGLLIACALDVPVSRWMRELRPGWTNRDPGHLLRIGGYLRTWFLVAAALMLHDRMRIGHWCFEVCRRALMLVTAACTAGLVAEILKLFVPRQ